MLGELYLGNGFERTDSGLEVATQAVNGLHQISMKLLQTLAQLLGHQRAIHRCQC
jgi:hypothetical protein